MAAITEWLRSKFQDPQTREEGEIHRIADAFSLSKALVEQRAEPVRNPDRGWTNPAKTAYFSDKMEATKLGSPYTFQVMTKANCYESVLQCIEKGDPQRHYAE